MSTCVRAGLAEHGEGEILPDFRNALGADCLPVFEESARSDIASDVNWRIIGCLWQILSRFPLLSVAI